MTFQFFKLPDHIDSNANPPAMTQKWKAVGNSDQNYVHAYALGATPSIVATIYGTIFRQDIQVKQTAYNHFTVTVPYGTRKNATGEWTWDFDTTGSTVHITNAKEEVGRYPTATAPNQRGAIAVDGDEVKGAEIVIPAMKINVTYKHPLGIITIPQAKFLASITGTVNSAPFLTFAAGEVLFLGARGSDGTSAEASVNYQFAMSSNATGLTIGEITGIAKKGHELAWVKYQDTTITVGGVSRPIREPKFVYVDRVYGDVDHATALGFGG
jgi:hypothetical protein